MHALVFAIVQMLCFHLTQGQDFYTGAHFTFIAFTFIHMVEASFQSVLGENVKVMQA